MAIMKNYSISKNKEQITSIAIGGFDGMHMAHQELFDNLDDKGAILVIDAGYANLTPKSIRQTYISFPVFYYELSKIKHLKGDEFIEYLKKDFPKLTKIVVGYDFCFGANRKHNIDDLKTLFKNEVCVIKEVLVDNISVHSRIIREYLKQGDIKTSTLLLGKNYKIKGVHIKGQGLGSKSFVPTINLKVDEYLIPQSGVYITRTIINSNKYNSISFLGHRVSTDNTYAIETHLLDKFEESNTEIVEVEFLEKIRDNQKFENFEALKNQILKDINHAKSFFK